MLNNLEKLRKEHKVSQQDFAQYLGVTRQTISSLENGRYNPSILLAMKIARYFGKSVENIFIYTEEEDNDET
ncbi:MAG: helix-turn-helix transcriptional regulator [Leuconostoc gelidum]|uniref:Helix-turn-helix transcriptional regulator n=1 Tax=Leuconostoc gelidum subsp. gelidum TaxID=1607839 RepID=A0AB35FZP3_LEUGE|nr:MULTISPECIES: helix-turn-helix transcriptional regulator [Leuconostoc gelidum group]MBZ5963570.1 helix-turn-helix transcriptional regulator [Leuconostoc gelidum subsp. gelidum]MBZ5975588.1 helix-turn-helix transcriptional regulator [Leuconostoc gelidum subsp. gelidum]MBZ5976244.1 helix-turn-helix transcriptional regulator [Leuconostoc gelidum subsp. gelidum]MBZ5978279.1 helix-turn-helix transcriptional regulator [Leuconostoc gelidum subsp. gelidum]MBZ5987027.1 helix-turn-helix transcription